MASSASTSTLSKIAVTMKVLRADWMSASWISCSLVVVQVSVSSSWRLAQSANTETIAMIVARTIRMIGSARRLVFLFASPSLTRPPYTHDVDVMHIGCEEPTEGGHGSLKDELKRQRERA